MMCSFVNFATTELKTKFPLENLKQILNLRNVDNGNIKVLQFL